MSQSLRCYFMIHDPFGLRNAVRAIWETKYKDAAQILSVSDDPLHKLHYAEVAFFEAMLSEETKDSHEALSRLTEAESAINNKLHPPKTSLFSSSEHKLSPHEKSLYHVALADVYAFSAGIYMRRGDYIRGAYNIRQSWKAFQLNYVSFGEDLPSREEDSNDVKKERIHDIKKSLSANGIESYRKSSLLFGMGAFYFFISLIPTNFLWVLEMIGFSADREFGLRLLQECAEHAGHRSPAALLLLLWLQSFFMEDLEASEKVLSDSILMIPEGSMFYYLAGYMRRKQGDMDEAISMFSSCYKYSSQSPDLLRMCKYELGWCYYLKLDWNTAIAYFEEFLKEQKAPSFKAYCAYQLGVCYHMIGDWSSALDSFKNVDGWARKHFTFDQYARRKSNEYISKNEISASEAYLLKFEILASAKQPDQAIAQMENAQEILTLDTEDWAVFLYWRGRALRSLHRFEESKKCFKLVIDLKQKITREIWILPHAYTEWGEITHEEGDNEGALKLFNHAKSDYSGYDLDKPLLRRIAKSLDLLKSNKSAVSRIWKKNAATACGGELHSTSSSTKSSHTSLANSQHKSGHTKHLKHSHEIRKSASPATKNRKNHHQHDETTDQYYSFESEDDISEGQFVSDNMDEDEEDDEEEEDDVDEMMSPNNSSRRDLSRIDSENMRTSITEERSDSNDGDDAGSEIESSTIFHIKNSSKPLLPSSKKDHKTKNNNTNSLNHRNGANSHSEVSFSTSAIYSVDLVDPTYEEKRRTDDELDDLLERLYHPSEGVEIRDLTQFPRVFPSCCTGYDVVQWLIDQGLTEDKSIEITNQLVETNRFIVVFPTSTTYTDINCRSVYLKFQLDVPHNYIMNTLKIWRLPPRHPSILTTHLNSMIHKLYSKYLDMDGVMLDLKSFKESSEFFKFRLATAELQRVDIHSLSEEEKFAFFLNMYNILVIHGTAIIGAPTSYFSRSSFFKKVSYNVGGYRFSLDEIEHGILRANSSPPGSLFNTFSSSDPRLIYKLKKIDPRIHFCLNCGAKSCPRLQLYTPEGFDAQLNCASALYLENNVTLDPTSRRIVLPAIIKWYKEDFGPNTESVLNYIIQFFDDKKQKILGDMIKSKRYSVYYNDYDWSSIYNC
eukprot:TRINITY_DN6623_c0_g1_i1.p1 TRINITY_DN6623_c0_g1~~TRINITY_DN6623_c0_g1_i1.p1  ORF type:complete len:1121 (+),score=202.26 TRINITY_DN6623_c0_g1_i1:125-3487(+)